jgi:spore coat protein A
MKIKLGWPMATLAILTFSIGSTTAVASQPTTGASGAMSPTAVAADPPCGQGPTSPIPTFFKDEAVQQPVAAPDSTNHYTLQANRNTTHSFSPGNGWPAVTTLGYAALKANGTANANVDYLGPTIVTKKGTPIDVTIKNNLPAAGTPLFPTSQFDLSMVPEPNRTANSVVLHRHGGLQPALSDGVPGQQSVAPGASRTNHYPNDQAAAPLWYHDHSDMVTSFNVYGGLAGIMPNTDTLEPGFNLPAGGFAKSYLLQDKSFNADKTMCYTHASPEFFGDLPVVNGTIAPKQTVQPRRYTFTFVNGSDSRVLNLTLKSATGLPTTTGPRMTVVGSDSGYLLKPVKVNSQLIAPGERYKVVVDFTGISGKWVLSNDAATPYPAGDPSVATVPQLMRFDVSAPLTGTDTSVIPATITETNNVQLPADLLLTARLRTVQAAEMSPGVPQLGNATIMGVPDGPATETPQLGSTEAWAMRNHSPDSHPIHEHLVELRLVGRWPVTKWSDQDPITGSAVPLAVGKFEAPGAFESGPKDTFVSPPDYISVWVGQYTIGGASVWHCHILSHEDGMDPMIGMMRPLVVGTAAQTQLPVIGTQKKLDQLIRQPIAN